MAKRGLGLRMLIGMLRCTHTDVIGEVPPGRFSELPHIAQQGAASHRRLPARKLSRFLLQALLQLLLGLLGHLAHKARAVLDDPSSFGDGLLEVGGIPSPWFPASTNMFEVDVLLNVVWGRRSCWRRLATVNISDFCVPNPVSWAMRSYTSFASVTPRMYLEGQPG